MAIIQIGDFGRDEKGVYTYRINGEKADLEHLIIECKKMGYRFYDPPEIERSYKEYTILLRVYIPKEIALPEAKNI